MVHALGPGRILNTFDAESVLEAGKWRIPSGQGFSLLSVTMIIMFWQGQLEDGSQFKGKLHHSKKVKEAGGTWSSWLYLVCNLEQRMMHACCYSAPFLFLCLQLKLGYSTSTIHDGPVFLNQCNTFNSYSQSPVIGVILELAGWKSL